MNTRFQEAKEAILDGLVRNNKNGKELHQRDWGNEGHVLVYIQPSNSTKLLEFHEIGNCVVLGVPFAEDAAYDVFVEYISGAVKEGDYAFGVSYDREDGVDYSNAVNDIWKYLQTGIKPAIPPCNVH